MEAVFPEPFLLCYFLIDGVCANIFGQSVVEDGVEGGDVLDTGKLFEADLYYGNCGGIVSAEDRVSIRLKKFCNIIRR